MSQPVASEQAQIVQPEAAKTDAEVTISPFTPSEEAMQLAQTAFDDPQGDDLNAIMDVKPISESEELASAPFIPPVAETPVASQRMPSVDDFPMIVREEIKAKSVSSLEVDDSEDRGPLGLLKRITNATLGGGKEDAADIENTEHGHVAVPLTATMPISPEPVVPQASNAAEESVTAKPVQPETVATPAQAAARSARGQTRQSQASNYAPQAGNLDPQGRVTPAASATTAEDQLEIPAFLRRQAQ